MQLLAEAKGCEEHGTTPHKLSHELAVPVRCHARIRCVWAATGCALNAWRCRTQPALLHSLPVQCCLAMSCLIR